MMFFRQHLARLLLMALVLVLLPALAGCERSEVEGTRYRCPMHPTYISDRPGACPICGMRLVPIEEPVPPARGASGAGDQGSSYTPLEPAGAPAPAPEPGAAAGPPVDSLAAVELTREALELAGVRTAAAQRGSLDRAVRTVGLVTADERRVRHVHTKISGWIEKLHVNFTGQAVRKGEPLLSIFSPELLASQQEFLRVHTAAARFARSDLEEVRTGGAELLAASRERLRLFDVPEAAILELERTGEPQRTVTLLAPVSGFVTVKSIFEGQQVEPGQELLAVTDISSVWIEADIYEFEVPAIRLGQRARLSLPYDPELRLSGTVSYVYPYLDVATRTLKVRFDFANPGLRLKPAMYVDVELLIESGDSVLVPDSAVMDTGTRQIAFVELEAGRFEPREVKVGVRNAGRVQVLEGIREGERVVVRANFLLDSESRLRAAIGSMPAGHDHGAASTTPEPRAAEATKATPRPGARP